jgi:general secretion pathway protein C
MNLPTTIQGLQNLAAGDTLGKVGKYLPSAAVVGLITLIAWQSARLTWILLPRPPEMAIVAPVALPSPVPGRGINAQKVAETHLFGVATAADDPGDLTNVKQSQMPLVLSGTIASADPTKGFAFIGESAVAAKFLKVGDAVGGSARLHLVYADRVMLDRGGQLEALLLPRTGTAILGARPKPATAMNAAPSRFAENVKRLAETNPAAFSEIVRPQAFVAQGVMQGFRVYPGRNRQQFAKLGLQPGDLVKAINGTPLDDPQRSGEIFNTLSISDRAQITIERNGQIQQLTLNTAQITLPDAPNDPQPQGMPPQDVRALDASGAPVQ